MANGKRREVQVTLVITFDHDDYCTAYGLHPDERSVVYADASRHLSEVAQEAANEAVQRLGVGASAKVVRRS